MTSYRFSFLSWPSVYQYILCLHHLLVISYPIYDCYIPFHQDLAEDVLMTSSQGYERSRFLAAAGRINDKCYDLLAHRKCNLMPLLYCAILLLMMPLLPHSPLILLFSTSFLSSKSNSFFFSLSLSAYCLSMFPIPVSIPLPIPLTISSVYLFFFSHSI